MSKREGTPFTFRMRPIKSWQEWSFIFKCFWVLYRRNTISGTDWMTGCRKLNTWERHWEKLQRTRNKWDSTKLRKSTQLKLYYQWRNLLSLLIWCILRLESQFIFPFTKQYQIKAKQEKQEIKEYFPCMLYTYMNIIQIHGFVTEKSTQIALQDFATGKNRNHLNYLILYRKPSDLPKNSKVQIILALVQCSLY